MSQQEVNGYTVTPAPAKSGHPYWNVKCECGTEKVVRASRVKSGAYQCACRRAAPAKQDWAGTVSGHSLPGLADQISALTALVVAQADAIEKLAAMFKQLLDGQLAVKPAGLKPVSLQQPPREVFTKAVLLAGADSATEKQARMQANRDWIAQQMTFDADVRNKDMLDDRMRIEQESAELDPDALRGAMRLSTLTQQRKRIQNA